MNMKRIGLAVIMVLCVMCARLGTKSEVTAASKPTLVLPAVITPASVSPGEIVKIQLKWQAGGPLKYKNFVFVHFIGSNGVVYTENHYPNVPTDSVKWKGKISYTCSIKLPETIPVGTDKILETLPAGKYQIAIGFYEPENKDMSDIQALAAGKGVSVLWGSFYVVGTVTVDSNAPLPKVDKE